MAKKLNYLIKKGCFIQGQRAIPGDVVDVAESLGRELVGNGHAEATEAPAKQAPRGTTTRVKGLPGD